VWCPLVSQTLKKKFYVNELSVYGKNRFYWFQYLTCIYIMCLWTQVLNSLNCKKISNYNNPSYRIFHEAKSYLHAKMSIATQEKIADFVQNVRQMATEAVDKVRSSNWGECLLVQLLYTAKSLAHLYSI